MLAYQGLIKLQQGLNDDRGLLHTLKNAVLVRKETLAYNPNDHAHAVMDPCNGWCSQCKKHHLESFGADLFQHPTECPKLAQPITGIFIDGDAGGNSLFAGHENMVGKRISQEFLNLQHLVILLP